jgi:hypothetical protein
VPCPSLATHRRDQQTSQLTYPAGDHCSPATRHVRSRNRQSSALALDAAQCGCDGGVGRILAAVGKRARRVLFVDQSIALGDRADGFCLPREATPGRARSLAAGFYEAQDCWCREGDVVVNAVRKTGPDVFAQDSDDGRARPRFNGA